MSNGRMGLWRAGWALAGFFDQLVQATRVGAQCDGHMGRRLLAAIDEHRVAKLATHHVVTG